LRVWALRTSGVYQSPLAASNLISRGRAGPCRGSRARLRFGRLRFDSRFAGVVQSFGHLVNRQSRHEQEAR